MPNTNETQSKLRPYPIEAEFEDEDLLRTGESGRDSDDKPEDKKEDLKNPIQPRSFPGLENDEERASTKENAIPDQSSR